MIKIKPQNPKGVRDFLPKENKNREYIIDVLKKQFEIFGFESIYTPAFERLETLVGKYGEEGEKLLFKILNSGNFLSETETLELIKNYPEQTSKITAQISSKGLRYDHTVPLARFVSQHQNELTFPFRRYAIGPVWRADRPQKGRYQEFFQCDIDVVGVRSLINDVEIVELISSVFKTLNLKVEIRVNNKNIFNGLCEYYKVEEHLVSISTIIDKWDKIGEEKVYEELVKLSEFTTEKALEFITELKSGALNALKMKNETIDKGISEIEYLFNNTDVGELVYDSKLVRGLDYYTGTVFEVVSTEMQYGSIAGGGRYDNLTEIFGMKDMAGIGFSFGLDRIYDIMIDLGKFEIIPKRKKLVVLNLSNELLSKYLKLVSNFRKMGMTSELYPVVTKMDKQLVYADKKEFDYALILGEDEMSKNQVSIKNLKKRTQETYSLSYFEKPNDTLIDNFS